MFVRVNRTVVFVVLPLFGVAACSARTDVAGDVDLRWLPRTALGAGAPVSERPAGDAVPFRDRNTNGRYDAFIDPIGYCNTEGDCHIPAERLTVHRLRRNGIAGSSAGILLSAQRGDAPPDDASTLDLSLCTDAGICSRSMQTPFDGLPEVQALWLCAEDSMAVDVTSVSVMSASPVQIVEHPHVRLVAGRRGAGVFDVSSSESIDRILVRLVQLDGDDVARVAWTSNGEATAVQLEGTNRARLTIPADATALCAECAVMIQVLHVWRDDEIRDISEAWLTLPLTEGAV